MSKVIESACIALLPVRTSVFNHCIDLGKCPVDWKYAKATLLCKNKEVKSNLYNLSSVSDKVTTDFKIFRNNPSHSNFNFNKT